MRADQVDLSVQFAGLTLRNPVMTASGTFGFGTEYEAWCVWGGLGRWSSRPRPSSRARGTGRPVSLRPRRGC